MLNFLTTKVFQPIAGALLLAMALVMAGNVAVRATTGDAPGWVITFLTDLAMPGVVFLGLLYTTLTHGHVRVDSFAARLSERKQIALRMLGWVLGVAFLVPIGIMNAVRAVGSLDDSGGHSWAVPGWLAYGTVSLATLLSAVILIGFLLSPRKALLEAPVGHSAE